jgi:hypothetical protein
LGNPFPTFIQSKDGFRVAVIARVTQW